MPKQLFFNLIKNVFPVKLENNILYLHCPNTVLAHAIDQYRDAILNELKKNKDLSDLKSIFIDNKSVDKTTKQDVDNSEEKVEYS